MNYKNYNFFWVLFFLQLNISGCGGRLPQPVEIERSEDSSITCEKIEEEIIFIREKVSKLLSESIKNNENDTIMGLFASFFPPAYILRDFRQAEKVEINALRKRHNRIVKLAQKMGCGKNKFFLQVEKQCKDYYVLDCFLP